MSHLRVRVIGFDWLRTQEDNISSKQGLSADAEDASIVRYSAFRLRRHEGGKIKLCYFHVGFEPVKIAAWKFVTSSDSQCSKLTRTIRFLNNKESESVFVVSAPMAPKTRNATGEFLVDVCLYRAGISWTVSGRSASNLWKLVQHWWLANYVTLMWKSNTVIYSATIQRISQLSLYWMSGQDVAQETEKRSECASLASAARSLFPVRHPFYSLSRARIFIQSVSKTLIRGVFRDMPTQRAPNPTNPIHPRFPTSSPLAANVTLQGPAKKWFPGCENSSGKARQKW